MNNDDDHTTHFQFSLPDGQEIFPGFSAAKYRQKPRKKRTKSMRIDNPIARRPKITRPKYGKKPDPAAPKITRPCSECGKKFWSWKALFGHMRCHPERQWRGINPPPNFRWPVSLGNTRDDHLEAGMTEDDHEVATCLLILANGATTAFETPTVPAITTATTNQDISESHQIVIRDVALGGGDVDASVPSVVNCRFECSSCKKVFGSHQALGGHRASHKNVKGCFAITRSDGEDFDQNGGHPDDKNGEGEVKDMSGEEKMVMVLRHKCSICLRVFSSGQALGGHKRCHWEKGDESSSLTQGLNPLGCGLDLNLPAPVEVDDDSSCSYSSGLALDLRSSTSTTWDVELHDIYMRPNN